MKEIKTKYYNSPDICDKQYVDSSIFFPSRGTIKEYLISNTDLLQELILEIRNEKINTIKNETNKH